MQRKLKLTLAFALVGQMVLAQTFTLATDTPFQNVTVGSLVFSDVDGDNDEDVFITGENNSLEKLTELYINDGLGDYTLMENTSFQGVVGSSIATADVDGDNDEDLLITGFGDQSNRVAILYLNDGSGNFTEVMDTPFLAVTNGSIAFADVDGDNDQDVFITGMNDSGFKSAVLYLNDGSGNFSIVSNIPFEGVNMSSIAFGDIDGDDDQDLLITGLSNSGSTISRFFINDGTGGFTWLVDTSVENIGFGSIAFDDIDGDDDQDLLISGSHLTKLYLNDGAGDFTELIDTPFLGVTGSSIAFADIDGDSDQDVLISGGTSSGTPIAILYTNDGVGNFTELMLLEGVMFGSVSFTDVDGDNDQDILLTGSNYLGLASTKLYLNEGIVSSLGDLSLTEDFKYELYPNPVLGNSVNIDYNSMNKGELDVQVYDLMGRLIKQYQEDKVNERASFSIDISDLNKGCYIFRLKDGLRYESKMLLVE